MRGRPLDIAIAGSVVVLTAPLMAIIAFAVRLSSRGPIIFRAARVGREDTRFTLYKFRSMHIATETGAGITVSGDDRITKVGRLLRRTKLDELPQMFNVLKGQMNIVGPRPEDPLYADWYPEELKQIFKFRPGITSPASVTFRDEEERLARLITDGSTLEAAYRTVLAQKIPIDLEYFASRTIASDLKWIARTFAAMLAVRPTES
ncbi:O-antigen biosynthesis protein WlbG [soil metagenome]